ncbi:hypothetical protein L202_03678 [Cryptococcus amylolentus CBS 6039]|uniref:Zn(2)-C6 fungal-type domain-containing protein n=1 Tax=Cryptococcus amylolentus CBS 6039 TaxID=1295533 RepID=A0A1E3HTU1_9TREE|nr:hypothetical protein L202_03678 [Cryptococcus amylolentus CBS 6039]ODN79767.1 hypothetical protein L202_03678 [Cryptococcus amylolentus CBS 6039]
MSHHHQLPGGYRPPHGDYFAAWNGPQQQTPQTYPPAHHPLPSPINIHPAIPTPDPSEWQSEAPKTSRKPPRAPSAAATKTTRQQFTACSACRHRRVKCDLKDKTEEAETAANDREGLGPHRGKAKVVQCSNCVERGLRCIDEFAPMKAAKLLRRGKRIAEIEVLYGANALPAQEDPTSPSKATSSLIPTRPMAHPSLPELSHAFFESSFFRRFQVQRPVIDPGNFVKRYRSQACPTAAAMGTEGAILCHVLYAWAVSYGVDEHGNMDQPDGGGQPLDTINLDQPTEVELEREKHRARRRAKMKEVIEIILKEIDEAGLLRKPTWDGVRVLLLILPLTDGISSPVERMSMYGAALSQVYTLCSHTAHNYDGEPSATAFVNGGVADDLEMTTVRVRVYWYSFVHEGITTGLKGGRLTLDDDDLETMQDMVENSALVRDSGAFRISSNFATAPISLALACRKINKALTGTAARRRTDVNGELLKQAWEALEKSWEEFDQLLAFGGGEYMLSDEVTRFADGWKIFLFEAQNVIYNNLEDRRQRLSDPAATLTARISSPSSPSSSSPPEIIHAALTTNITHLLDIARSKCEMKTRQILVLVRKYVGTTFFEWDASLVRDGTYYAALWVARGMGTGEDVGVCLRALNELRWAHAKAVERSADLRKLWHEHASSPASQDDKAWDNILSNLESLGRPDHVRAPEQPHEGHSSSGGSGQTSNSNSSSRVPQLVPYNLQQSSYELQQGQSNQFAAHDSRPPLPQRQSYTHTPYPAEISHPHFPANVPSSSNSPFTSPLIISPYEPSVQMHGAGMLASVYSQSEQEGYGHVAQYQQVHMGTMPFEEMAQPGHYGGDQYEAFNERGGAGYGEYKEPYNGQSFQPQFHQHQQSSQGYASLHVQQGMPAPDHHQQYQEQSHSLFDESGMQGLGVQGQFIIQPDGSHTYNPYLHNNQHR